MRNAHIKFQLLIINNFDFFTRYIDSMAVNSFLLVCDKQENTNIQKYLSKVHSIRRYIQSSERKLVVPEVLLNGTYRASMPSRKKKPCLREISNHLYTHTIVFIMCVCSISSNTLYIFPQV